MRKLLGLLAGLALLCEPILQAQTITSNMFYKAAITTAVTVKPSSGIFYGWFIYNPNSSACYLDIFSVTNPVLGTTLPVGTLPIPATSGANAFIPGSGTPFSSAMAVAAVTASGGGTTCTTGMTVTLWYQ